MKLTIVGKKFECSDEILRALRKVVNVFGAQKFIVGCTKCKTVCVSGVPPMFAALCACCQNYDDIKRRRPSGRPAARAVDLGEHVRGPLDMVLAEAMVHA